MEHSELSGGNAYAGIVVANPTPATLVVSDVVFRNYANGISTAGAGQLDLVVERTQALGTSYAGVLLSGTNVRAIMKESVLSGSLYGAVVDCPTPSASVAMTAESNLISHNQYGVLMNAADTCTSQLTLSNNVIANNDSGIYFAASIATPVVYTRTNNTFTGNMSDVSGAPAHPLTPLTPK